eukprot:4175855-Pyramimonas_sp.AAC.1
MPQQWRPLAPFKRFASLYEGCADERLIWFHSAVGDANAECEAARVREHNFKYVLKQAPVLSSHGL